MLNLNSTLNSLALALPTSFNFIHFVMGFLILICVIAIVNIGVKWLMGLAGVPIPPPLMAILGILLFIVLLIMLLDWSGVGVW